MGSGGRATKAASAGDIFERIFATNVFGYFHMTKAVLPHLKAGDAVVNTTSVTAYKGSGELLDYASTRGAIVAFTRSLAQQLNERKIRVNGVAPGPIWTPLISASFDQSWLSESSSIVYPLIALRFSALHARSHESRPKRATTASMNSHGVP